MGDSGSLPATMLVVGEEVRIDEDYYNEFKMHTRNFINEVFENKNNLNFFGKVIHLFHNGTERDLKQRGSRLTVQNSI